MPSRGRPPQHTPCRCSMVWPAKDRKFSGSRLRGDDSGRFIASHILSRGRTAEARFFHATGAATAVRLDEQLEILLAIVVGDFFARFDRLDGAQDRLALADRAFGVRPAGMVGIAADITARRAVDGPAAVDLEHVAGAGCALARLGFTRRNALAGIFDDDRATPDRGGREQAEPCRRAADAITAVAPARHAAASRMRITASSVATGTGSRSVLRPGQPAVASRSTSLSAASGALLTIRTAIVTFWNAEEGAPSIMWPRTSKSVRATASKLS